MRDRRVQDLKPGDRIICPNSGATEEVVFVDIVGRAWLLHTTEHEHSGQFVSHRFRLAEA